MVEWFLSNEVTGISVLSGSDSTDPAESNVWRTGPDRSHCPFAFYVASVGLR